MKIEVLPGWEMYCVCVCLSVGSRDGCSEAELAATPLVRHEALGLCGVRTTEYKVSDVLCVSQNYYIDDL